MPRSSATALLLLLPLSLALSAIAVESYNWKTHWGAVKRFNQVAPPGYSIVDAEHAAVRGMNFLRGEARATYAESKWLTRHDKDVLGPRYWKFAPILDSDMKLKTIKGPDGPVPVLDVLMLKNAEGTHLPVPFAILRPKTKISERQRKFTIRFEIIHDYTRDEHSVLIKGLRDRLAVTSPEARPPSAKEFYADAFNAIVRSKELQPQPLAIFPAEDAPMWRKPRLIEDDSDHTSVNEERLEDMVDESTLSVDEEMLEKMVDELTQLVNMPMHYATRS